MSLAPLFAAGPIVFSHALAAFAAFALGATQLARAKGTRSHRALGWAWVTLMGIVATGSFWIHDLREVGPFSFIHLISIFTLVMLVLAVVHARAGRIEAHRRTMIGLFLGALVITSLLTLLPGRVMNHVVFGS